MKIENVSTSNWQNAFRGMRNPYDSWNKSDSFFGIEHYTQLEKIARLNPTHKIEKISENEDLIEYAALGLEDIDLAQRLIKGGPVHSKFLRQIFISMDITAPLYW